MGRQVLRNSVRIYHLTLRKSPNPFYLILVTQVRTSYNRPGEMFSVLSVHPVGVLVRCGGVLDSALVWSGALAANRYQQCE
jgi:hypothetical protein